MFNQHGQRADEKPQSSQSDVAGADTLVQASESTPVVETLTVEPAESHPIDVSNTTDIGAQKPARIKAAKERLGKLIAQNEKNLWEIGDLLIELTKDGVNLAELECLGWKQARLSQIRSTAEEFTLGDRNPTVPFYTHEVARTASNRLKREVEKRLQQNPSPEIRKALTEAIPLVSSPKAALKVILGEEMVLKPTKKGVKRKKLKQREATNLLGTIVRKAIDAATPMAAPMQEHPILDHCFLSTNEALLSGWIEQDTTLKAKLIGMDPPYGRYDKHEDGHLDINTSAAQFVEADNISRDEAMATTAATIRLLPTFLAEGGAILLWQAAQSLHPTVHAALLESGFEEDMVLVWDKDRPQPGDFTEALTQQCELCYVWKLKGSKLLNHDASIPRSNVIRDIWFKNPASPIENSHICRKPEELMELLVRKYTYQGDIVLDLFACSGSLSKAAAKLNRRFVYVESRAENFKVQSPDVLRTLEEAQKARNQTANKDAA